MIFLKLKVAMARRDGKKEIVLTMEEAMAILEQTKKMDEECSKLFGLLSDEDRTVITDKMFGKD